MKDSNVTLWKKMLIVLLFVVAILSGIFKNCDYDSWYHLKSGEILYLNKSFPQYDPFYYSLNNQPFTKAYWFFQIILYIIYKISGVNGMTVLQCITLCITVFFVYKLGKLKTNSFFITAIVLLAVIMKLQGRFYPRPEIFGIVFFSFCLYLINLYLIKNRNYLFLIPIICIVWVNSHPSFIFGLATLFIYIIGSLINNLISRIIFSNNQKILTKATINLCITFIISLLSCLLNPDHLHVFKGLFQFYSSIQNEFLVQRIQELQSYNLKHNLFTFFSLILLACILSFLARIKKIDFPELFLFVFFAYLFLHAVRFEALFMVVTGLILFSNLEYLNHILKKRQFPYITRLTQFQYVLLPILILLVGLYMPGLLTGPYTDYQFGFGASFARFPVKLVDFIEKNNITGKMLNPLHYGGYLEWRLYPRQKVFIDGRMLGDSNFRNEYFFMHNQKETWENAKRKYDFDYIITEYSPEEGNDYLTIILANSNDYKIVYFDNANILFLKNSIQYETLISSYAFRYISPFNDVMEKLMTAFPHNQELRTAARNELVRLLTLNNDLEKEHFYLGSIYYLDKDYANALVEYFKVLQIAPSITGVHHNLGLIYYERNDYKKAINEWNIELTLAPDSIKTRLALARIYMMSGEYQKSKEQCALILTKEPGNKLASDLLQWIKANVKE